MRERFDAGTGLVAVGAVLLLVSLFIDWYDPGGDAWAVFESLDLVLAGAAVCGLLAVAPRFGTAAWAARCRSSRASRSSSWSCSSSIRRPS